MGGCHLEIRDILLFADCIPTSIYIYISTTKTLYTVSREVVRLCESQKKGGEGGRYSDYVKLLIVFGTYLELEFAS
jgi:hypothetical protein